MTPQQALRHHVTGAIERGEKEAIVEQPVVAHCSPEIADWLDPSRDLRRGGLLIVDQPSIGLPYQVPGSKEIRFNP